MNILAPKTGILQILAKKQNDEFLKNGSNNSD
jgi:hypothetical protein